MVYLSFENYFEQAWKGIDIFGKGFCSPFIKLYIGRICSICSIFSMLHCSSSANIPSALFALHWADYTAWNHTGILYIPTLPRGGMFCEIHPPRTERSPERCKIFAQGKSQGISHSLIISRERLILSLSILGLKMRECRYTWSPIQ